MTVKEELEYLKTEFMINMSDATRESNLDAPFELKFSLEEEQNFLPRGAKARLVLKHAFIILDNTYKKVRLYPTDDFIEAFEETLEDTCNDLKRNIMEAYLQEQLYFPNTDYVGYDKYTDELIVRIKDHAAPYIEKLRKLTPEEVEMEIKMKDRVKKAEEASLIHFDYKNPKGLF